MACARSRARADGRDRGCGEQGAAPSIAQHGYELLEADESALYHHYELNYKPPETESGRRFARR